MSLASILNELRESAGDMMALSDKTNFERRPHPIQFELVSYRGEIFGPFESVSHAVLVAKTKWPHQEQDEDRTGKGWDVQVAGS